ncbi:hypothetical protein [Cellulosimicrobium protaetiae]|uniref:Uncharacterized protein n=1 Tax=Cellulosimicrobium protaetiae TaxID=2587808 RepID=A0A6M5UB37_9MICO|nr:hypothetical protein [Cellulosimicrobium protaetiae]QJW35324.1 hypothetical protein FIC82_003020 [Cellulosimicrobium protaetiae]
MTDHDDAAFAAALRTAVAPDGLRSTLDPHRVLTSSRRAQRRRRTATLSATAGCAAAVGLLAGPLSPRAGVDAAPPAAGGSSGAAGVAEIAPGVTAATDPRVHDRAGGGVVVDLGLPTWEPGSRFFVTVEPGAVDLPLQVWAGDDSDLETLLAGADLSGGPVVASRGDLALVTGPGGDDQLAVGLVLDQEEVEDPKVVTVVARETLRGPEGEARATLDLPVSPLAAGSWGGVFAMRVADARTDLAAPAVRGVFLRDTYGRNVAYGGCDTDPDPAACATVWDAAAGSRTAATRSSEPSADDVAVQVFADDYAANDLWASQGHFVVAACPQERRALDAARGLTRDDDDLRWQCEADDAADWDRWTADATP